ncbi:ankyrin repeat domain-containing protein [Dyella psychrodurans]|uniref:Ankyrin repeat domain-containing protein n=1 Tax=Dyella psychrodurans TaxID=1927960 RepID=A0A370XBY0_9GAMM|nr:ankyrin repeat domain-containing protein [Dyella psychrodurans]RDS85909.1 ankyrin repeat domain-containing protein [Dyella psychrodurans]
MSLPTLTDRPSRLYARVERVLGGWPRHEQETYWAHSDAWAIAALDWLNGQRAGRAIWVATYEPGDGTTRPLAHIVVEAAGTQWDTSGPGAIARWETAHPGSVTWTLASADSLRALRLEHSGRTVDPQRVMEAATRIRGREQERLHDMNARVRAVLADRTPNLVDLMEAIDEGAALTARAPDGRTVLQWALDRDPNDAEFLTYLMNCGAYVLQPGRDGLTALDQAHRTGAFDARDLMLTHFSHEQRRLLLGHLRAHHTQEQDGAKPSVWEQAEVAASTRVADPLTVAYMAKGAADVLKHLPRLPKGIAGELDLVDQVIAHAPLIDAMADLRRDDLAGVFVYEVAEPLGAFIAQRLVAGDGVDLQDAVRVKARALVADCCMDAGTNQTSGQRTTTTQGWEREL